MTPDAPRRDEAGRWLTQWMLRANRTNVRPWWPWRPPSGFSKKLVLSWQRALADLLQFAFQERYVLVFLRGEFLA